ncbi:hypothetical protein SAMN05216167_15017 [Spirosoma endophyticum]|uniref:Uncharacterized protein n=1 Tax=Spirosoma endophyticum TaxID=662367 RepID=A0A1I2HX79_9BACT|nr:hypothetical protein SAMN05216167_15017 [Spirosoma endophyticum]
MFNTLKTLPTVGFFRVKRLSPLRLSGVKKMLALVVYEPL